MGGKGELLCTIAKASRELRAFIATFIFYKRILSKYIQVNKALSVIEQGRFQILCNDFLKHGYQGDLHSPGTVEGKEKSRKGRPDSYIIKPDGQYILCEFTTKDSSDKNAFESKLRGDLLDCLNFSELGLNAHQVDQIVLCCNSTIGIELANELSQLLPHAIRLRIVGIDTLSTYYSSSGKLFARDFLNINFDTGQILDKAGFIERYSKKDLSTPLTNTLMGRDRELGALLGVITKRAVTLLLGPAGTGKTRLAIQAMDEFTAANPQYTPYYIFGKSGDIVEDLITFLEPGKSYLLLIDDANRQLDNLLSVLDRLFDDNSNIKILITVRDYAREDVLKHIRKLDFEGYPLEKLSDEVIQQVLAGEPFSIVDWTARKKISDIAKGNPRLAIMAARVYRQQPDLSTVSDVSAIYEQYFQSITDDAHMFGNEQAMKVMGILSFFNSIDITSEFDLEILATFSLSVSEFFSTVQQLEDMEIVEIYQQNVARITEQILSTYMFYEVFINKGLLSFKTLLDRYLEKNQFRFKDTLLPVIGVFGPAKVVGRHKTMLLDTFDRLCEQSHLAYQFMELFGPYLPEQLFTFVYTEINNAEPAPESEGQALYQQRLFSNKSPLLNLLNPFFMQAGEDFVTAIVLGFRFVNKRPERLSDFIDQLKNDLHPAGEEVATAFPRLQLALNWLRDPANRSINTNQCFYRIFAHCFLNTHYQEEFYLVGESGYELHPNFAAMRGLFWQTLTENYAVHSTLIDPLLTDYLAHEAHLNHVLLHFDEPFLRIFIEQNMLPEKFSDCFFVQQYLRLIIHKTGSLPEEYKPLKNKFNRKAYRIYHILSFNSYRGDYDYSKVESIRAAAIEKQLPANDISSFKRLYKYIAEILQHSGQSRNIVAEGLGAILANSVRHDLDNGLAVLIYYLKMGNQGWINSIHIFRVVFERYPQAAQRLYDLIGKIDFPYRQSWLQSFFYCLPEELVTPGWSVAMLVCYHDTWSDNTPFYAEHFLRYENVRKDSIFDLLTILSEKRKANPEFIYKISHDFLRKFPLLVDNHLAFTQSLYLQQENIDPHYDRYTDELFLLLDKDISFFDAYMHHLLEHHERSFSTSNKLLNRIWAYEGAAEMVYAAIIRMRQLRYWSTVNHLTSIFFVQVQPEYLDSALAVLDRLLNDFKEDTQMLNIILDITRNSLNEQYHPYIKKILLANPSIEIFKKLEFYNNHFSSNGSQIWADFKADQLLDVYELIRKELQQPWNYLEHQDILSRRIAIQKENADWERRLKFRGFW